MTKHNRIETMQQWMHAVIEANVKPRNIRMLDIKLELQTNCLLPFYYL